MNGTKKTTEHRNNQTEESKMSQSVKTIIYPVKDLAQAKKFYTTLLGVEPFADSPYYVGFMIGDQQIGLDPNGHKSGMTGPVPYYPVDDIRKSLQSLLDAGAQMLQDVKDVGGGGLIASVKDADGNIIGLSGLSQEPTK
jgi:predicted enzyme related to lactoylglutathione lyase